GIGAPIVVSNEEHRFLVAEQLREIGVAPAAHILEPFGRNTAPAVAAAALMLLERDPDAALLVLPSDHMIRDIDAFRDCVARARALAERGSLVTFGLRPDEPNTGYGYIRRGAAVTGTQQAFAVAEFVEKPDRARAADYVASGQYFWNSGMFVFTARRYVEELEALRPDIVSATRRAMAKGVPDLDFLRLDAEEFSACPSESIDYAVMERTRSACVVTADFGWSDIGS